MKTNTLFLVFFLLVTGCYSTSEYGKYHFLKPYEPVYSYWDNGREMMCNTSDGIFISMGFHAYDLNFKEFILDVVIENNSDSAVLFDPSAIDIFRYANDQTLAKHKIYHPIDPLEKIDSLNKLIKAQNRRSNGNLALGIFCGLLQVTSEVAYIASKDDTPEERQATRANYAETRESIQETRSRIENKINDLRYRQNYWAEDVLWKSAINEGETLSGKLHLPVPLSPQYRVYIPINKRVFRFAFIGEE